MPWKDFGRKEAVKAKPKELTYLEWGRNMASESPLSQSNVESPS